MIYHIIPVNDIKDHIESGETVCHCDPTYEWQESGDLIIIHNSYDGREGLELANEILNNQ